MKLLGCFLVCLLPVMCKEVETRWETGNLCFLATLDRGLSMTNSPMMNICAVLIPSAIEDDRPTGLGGIEYSDGLLSILSFTVEGVLIAKSLLDGMLPCIFLCLNPTKTSLSKLMCRGFYLCTFFDRRFGLLWPKRRPCFTTFLKGMIWLDF